MSTLKEIRTALGMSQSEVGKIINVQQSNYSAYESGTALPCMEDMAILEKTFGQRIDWETSLTVQEEREIMESVLTLCKYYPITAVLTFTQKAIREGIRLGKPAILVRNYASMASKIVEDVKPIPPTGVKFKEED